MSADLPAHAPHADEIDRVCNRLALASIPTRLRALRALATGDRDAAALAAACGCAMDGGLSGQVDLLRSGGLVELGTVGDPTAGGERREVYRITTAGRAVAQAARVAGAA